MSRITPFLWYDSEAEEAARQYVSIFPNSRIVSVSRYGDAGPGPVGKAMTVEFELDGQLFTALNGGPHHEFTEAVSFVVPCKSQEEIDRRWAALAEGGEEGKCGWLKDRYGLSWQVVPERLGAMLGDRDPQRAGRVMQAMLKMKKMDLPALERAFAG